MNHSGIGSTQIIYSKTTPTMKKKILKMALFIALSGNFLHLSGQSTCFILSNGTQVCHAINTISTIRILNGNLTIQFTQQSNASYPLDEIRKMIFTTVPINQVRQSQPTPMRIYPNPVSDILTIEMPESSRGSGTIEIYSMDGRLIQTLRSTMVNSTTQINVSSLSQGVYICRIRTGNQTSSLQFVKQ